MILEEEVMANKEKTASPFLKCRRPRTLVVDKLARERYVDARAVIDLSLH
jgi:hypothetical protein